VRKKEGSAETCGPVGYYFLSTGKDTQRGLWQCAAGREIPRAHGHRACTLLAGIELDASSVGRQEGEKTLGSKALGLLPDKDKVDHPKNKCARLYWHLSAWRQKAGRARKVRRKPARRGSFLKKNSPTFALSRLPSELF